MQVVTNPIYFGHLPDIQWPLFSHRISVRMFAALHVRVLNIPLPTYVELTYWDLMVCNQGVLLKFMHIGLIVCFRVLRLLIKSVFLNVTQRCMLFKKQSFEVLSTIVSFLGVT